jgi:hypothetical protein
MRLEDLQWDYSNYALNSIPYNGCVIVSIVTGCGCYVFIKRRTFLKSCVMTLMFMAAIAVHFVAHRNPAFETFVVRDLMTMFALGFAGALVCDAWHQRKNAKRVNPDR